MTITLLKVKKAKGNQKKWTAVFKIEKDGITKELERSFGYRNIDDPSNDFTLHGDRERRNRYIMRSKGHLKTEDPTRAGFLSMFLLWNKSTLKKSVADYNKRLKEYNETGKFPYQDFLDEAFMEISKQSSKKKEENKDYSEKKKDKDKFTVDL